MLETLENIEPIEPTLSFTMNDDDDMTIDLMHMLANGGDVVVNEMNNRPSKTDEHSLQSVSSFDAIFDDETIPEKASSHSAESKATEAPLGSDIEFVFDNKALKADSKPHDIDTTLVQNPQPIQSWSHQGNSVSGNPMPRRPSHARRRQMHTSANTNNMMDPTMLQQNLAMARTKLWRSMQQSELSRAHIDQIIVQQNAHAAPRRNSTNSFNLETSRNRLKASFAAVSELNTQSQFDTDSHAPNLPSSYANVPDTHGPNRNFVEFPNVAPNHGAFRRNTWHGENAILPPAHILEQAIHQPVIHQPPSQRQFRRHNSGDTTNLNGENRPQNDMINYGVNQQYAANNHAFPYHPSGPPRYHPGYHGS